MVFASMCAARRRPVAATPPGLVGVAPVTRAIRSLCPVESRLPGPYAHHVRRKAELHALALPPRSRPREQQEDQQLAAESHSRLVAIADEEQCLDRSDERVAVRVPGRGDLD